MKRASYRDGVDFIAQNDEVADMDPESIQGFISTQLVAQLFDVPTFRVATDVVRLRKKILKEEERRHREGLSGAARHPGTREFTIDGKKYLAVDAKDAHRQARQVATSNLAMKRKLDTGDCLDVLKIGTLVEPGVYELRQFFENVDYCDASKESWIWSIGKRASDGKVFAAVDARYYQAADYECLWLR